MAIVPYSGQVSYDDIRSQFGSPSNFSLSEAWGGTYGGLNGYSYIQPVNPGVSDYSPNQWYGYVGDYIYTTGLVTTYDGWPYVGSYPGSGNNIIDTNGSPPHNATMVNGTTWTNTYGGYFTFDGTDDNIRGTSPYYTFTNQVTVDFWVKWDVNTNINYGQGIGQAVLYNYDNPGDTMWLMHGNGGGQNSVSFHVKGYPDINLGGATTSQLTMGSWYNIIGTMDSGGSAIYLNGTQEATAGGFGGINMNTKSNSVLYLGGDVRYDFRFMNGSIAACHIYNVALTQAQVTQNFNALRGRFGI